MPRIFISYRRMDSLTITGRIHDHLVTAFSEANVFKDVDDIPLGADFRRTLEGEVSACDVLLAVIGPTWLEASDEQNRRRIDDPDDFVRIEVAAGLRREDVLVIPVLVRNATMPGSAELPADLRDLAYRNAAFIRDDPDFTRDMGRLVDTIRRSFAAAREADARPAPAPRPPEGRPVVTRPWLVGIVAALGVVAIAIVLAVAASGSAGPVQPVEVPTDNWTVASGEGAIRCGDAVSGTITEDDEDDVWTFEAEAGQTVLITANRSSGDLDPLIHLKTADDELAVDDDNGPGQNSAIYYTLGEDTTYQVLVTRFESGTSLTSGDYALELSCDVRPIECGEYQYESISAGGEEDWWVFYVAVGKTITATMAHTGTDDRGIYVSPSLNLYDTQGHELASAGGFEVQLIAAIEEEGIYLLRASAATNAGQGSAGPYALELACLEGSPDQQ